MQNPAIAPRTLPSAAQTVPQTTPKTSPAAAANSVRGTNSRLAMTWRPRNTSGAMAGERAITLPIAAGSRAARQCHAPAMPAASRTNRISRALRRRSCSWAATIRVPHGFLAHLISEAWADTAGTACRSVTPTSPTRSGRVRRRCNQYTPMRSTMPTPRRSNTPYLDSPAWRGR